MKGDHYQCYYCGLKHEDVEAGGIYSCPNVLCTGPGGAWFRRKLSSYSETGEQHSVDETEWKTKALQYSDTLNDQHLQKIIRQIAAGILRPGRWADNFKSGPQPLLDPV